MTTLKLTPLQVEIIRDRLKVADCIAEALTDDGDYQYDVDTIEARGYELLASLPDVGPATIEVDDVLTRDILWDCLDGSTYVAMLKDQVDMDNMPKNRSLLSAAIRAHDQLLSKINGL